MREIIEDSIAATSTLFEERAVNLRTALDADVPPVLADRDRLVQVMLNLLSNAVKFCKSAGGEVTVGLRRDGSMVRVDVRDNGVGISLDNQAMVFEKFRQGGDTMTGKPQGTGLGLPICRQIINHFGGRLWVESEIGQGSTFAFVLPVLSATRSERAAA
jgi:signal transduction histidine kinase